MIRSMPKRAYLASLEARVRHNRQVVESVFVPLDWEQRSRQPAPKEWSIDQCFQHLILAFEFHSSNTIAALDKPEPSDADGIFRPSWWARRLHKWQFDPSTTLPTMGRFNPPEAYSPDVFTRFLAQQDRLLSMIEQAAHADLQTMCWFIKGLPIRNNLGDYLNFLVAHDELHMDQAKRALAAAADPLGRV